MKIEGFVGNLDISTANVTDVLGRLAVGDIIRAKVLNIVANELMLKLFDGTTFSANSLSSLDIEQGDTVDFVVKNNSNNQLVLETVKGNDYNQKSVSNTDSNLKKQLLELDIKPDKKNMEIAKEIKQNDLPLNKDVFGKIADTIISFKNVTPQKVAYLIANNIIPEEKNIALLNQIIDEKQKISPMLQDTFKTLSEITDKDVITSISHALKEASVVKSPDQGKSATNSYPTKQEFIRNTVEKAVTAGSSSVFNDPTIPEIKEKLIEFINVNSKKVFSDNPDLTDNKMLMEKAVLFLKENVQNFEKSNIFQGKFIDSILKNVFQKLNEKSNLTDALVKNEMPAKQPLEKADYEKALKDVLDKFYVKVDEGTSGEDLKIKKVYKEMYEKLDVIKSAIEHSNPANKDELLNKIDNLQGNLKFINELNNHSTYIQIPLKMFDKNTTGELYVLKKGSRGKKIDPQNASVLVSLNTQNLGQVDSLISVNKKNISLNLRVEDQSIISFIKENYIELYNSLRAKGYKLVDAKYRLIDERINVINADRTMKKELDLSSQSIDCKI